MRILILFALALAAPVAASKDFRTLDFGQPCNALAKGEAALGSRYSSGDELSMIFDGSYQGLPAKIVYFCRENLFYRGSYFFQSASLAEANALYEQLKRMLITERGEPTVDGRAQQRQMESELKTTITSAEASTLLWLTKQTETSLMTIGPRHDGSATVAMSFGVREL